MSRGTVGLLAGALAFWPLAGGAQRAQPQPGHAIGQVRTQGNLIVLTLDAGALGHANLFDLDERTLRFTPEAGGYRVENLPLEWDADFGSQAAPGDVTLQKFKFPFSGQTWDTLSMGATGSIRFGAPPPSAVAGGRNFGPGRRGGGVALARFAQLQQAAPALVNTSPAICVFLKPRMQGPHYVKEQADRVVITWNLSEPAGGIQDFTWTPTVNRFQAVLEQDGTILLSYNQVAARDAIVGVYPAAADGAGAPRAVDFSRLNPAGGPLPGAYEAFHYLSLPNSRDLACSVIQALGDKFDMLAYYSDFRVDNQEAGTPSNGPRGGGPAGGEVTGIGAPQRDLAGYCTQGRFQWGFIQPVYAGANQMQPGPPPGLHDPNRHNLMAYEAQLREGSPDGTLPTYAYAMSQIGHEMGHRWSAFVSAKIGDQLIPLGPTHWARGLQAPAPFPYLRPIEASAMGGGVWQENGDGTYTQVDDDYYVPPTAYSYLDLYLMGLVAPEEVPSFFLLTHLQPAGQDAFGRPVFKADRTEVTIQDVIAAEGPRLPDAAHSQRHFNTGMVMVVEHGRQPSAALAAETEAIREHWIAYFARATGGRAVMTANPH